MTDQDRYNVALDLLQWLADEEILYGENWWTCHTPEEIANIYKVRQRLDAVSHAKMLKALVEEFDAGVANLQHLRESAE